MNINEKLYWAIAVIISLYYAFRGAVFQSKERREK